MNGADKANAGALGKRNIRKALALIGKQHQRARNPKVEKSRRPVRCGDQRKAFEVSFRRNVKKARRASTASSLGIDTQSFIRGVDETRNVLAGRGLQPGVDLAAISLLPIDNGDRVLPNLDRTVTHPR
jgi:hypothetical protein